MGFLSFGKKGKCSGCGEKIAKGAIFCHYCGSPQDTALIACGKCGAANPSDSDYCKTCGGKIVADNQPLTRQREADKIKGGVWARDADQFAVRFDDDDIKGTFKKTIVVEPGTRAILISNGKFAGDLPSGKYDVGGLASKLGSFDPGLKTTIVLINDGAIYTQLNAENLVTKEGFNIDAVLRLTFQIDNPFNFFTNLMQGQNSYTIDDFQAHISDQIKAELKPVIHQYDYEQLVFIDSKMIEEITDKIRESLHDSMQRSGIKLTDFQTINIISEEMASLAQTRGELRIREAELKIELEKLDVDNQEWEVEKKAIDLKLNKVQDEVKFEFLQKRIEVARKDGLEDIDFESEQKRVDRLAESLGLGRKEEELKVEDREKRVALLNRMRVAGTIDKLSLARNDDEFDRAKMEIDRGKLLRDDEWQQLKDEFDNNKDDRLSLRKFMKEKVGTLRDQELEVIRDDFSKRMADSKDEAQLKKLQAELQRKGYLSAFERSEWEADLSLKIQGKKEEHLADLANKKASAQTEHEIQGLDLEIRRKTVELEDYEIQLDQGALRRQKQIKIEFQRAEMELDREQKEFEHKLMMAERKWEHEAGLDLKKIDHQHGMESKGLDQQFELDKMDKMAMMGPEALIASSPAAQAQMLAELKKSENMSHMSEDQILALAAKDSPEVAKAFQERFKAQGGAEFYDMLIKSKDDQIQQQERFREETRRTAEDNAARSERYFKTGVSSTVSSQREQIESERKHTENVMGMGDRSQDRQRDVGVAQAGGKVSGEGGVQKSGESGRNCPACGKEMEKGWTLCPYCRHDFKGD